MFSHLSYYTQDGFNKGGTIGYYINEEYRNGVYFCSSGSTYILKEYVIGLNGKVFTYNVGKGPVKFFFRLVFFVFCLSLFPMISTLLNF